MNKHNYNPFNKPIEKLSLSDLHSLENVSEGWFLDYKEDVISPKKLSKHFAAFANQYGGWLIFGISETEANIPDKFIGIAKEKLDGLLHKAREAVSKHINPTVYYEEKILRGPFEELGMKDERAIVIFYIPSGTQAPYIHSSGKIYRRVADSSDPKAETDRHILDNLWKRGKEINKRLSDFALYAGSTKKIQNPIAKICFFSNPTFEIEPRFLKFNEFDEIMTESKELGVPMNNIHSCPGGFIARQINSGMDPLSPIMSFKWSHWGNCQIILPLNIIQQDEPRPIKNYDYLDDFLDCLESNHFEYANFYDLNTFCQSIVAMGYQFKQLLKKVDIEKELYASIHIKSTQNFIPFINDSFFIEQISKYGVPVINEKEIQIPFSLTPDSLVKLFNDPISENLLVSEFGANSFLFAYVLKNMGVLNSLEDIGKLRAIFSFQS